MIQANINELLNGRERAKPQPLPNARNEAR